MHSLETIKKLNGEFPEDPAAPILEPYDVAGAIIAYEGEGMPEGAVIELFQHLVDTGLAWTLQGSYGLQARRLIGAGLVAIPPGTARLDTREQRNFAAACKEPMRKGRCAP